MIREGVPEQVTCEPGPELVEGAGGGGGVGGEEEHVSAKGLRRESLERFRDSKVNMARDQRKGEVRIGRKRAKPAIERITALL